MKKTVLLKEPLKPFKLISTATDIKTLCRLLDCELVQQIKIPARPDIAILCDEEARLKAKTLNFYLSPVSSCIVGTVIFCATTPSAWEHLSEEQLCWLKRTTHLNFFGKFKNSDIQLY